jgi:hypothetical protein
MKKTLFTAIALFSLTTLLFAQKSSEETLADVAIHALIETDDYGSKLLLLEYVEYMLVSDPQGTSVMDTLTHLAGEGVWTVSYAKGKPLNDFADIRERACALLGKIPTAAAKNVLIRTLYADTNVQVLTTAIRSLTAIGMNTNDDVITAIIKTQHTNAVLYQTRPSDRLALESLSSYEKLAPTVNNKAQMIQSLFSMCTNYHYSITTRKRANALLRSIIMK